MSRCCDSDMMNNLMNMARAGYFTCVWRLNLCLISKGSENFFTIEDLAHVFDVCPKLTHLTIQMSVDRPAAANTKQFRDLESQLRQGFGRLERMELIYCLDDLFQSSWLIYQEMLT
jgi:hypothetical protein